MVVVGRVEVNSTLVFNNGGWWGTEFLSGGTGQAEASEAGAQDRSLGAFGAEHGVRPHHLHQS